MILLILNLPFVLFGLYKAAMLFETKKIGRVSLVARLVFWLAVLTGLIFAQKVYEYLTEHGLTDSTPLSLADVVLTTGLFTVLFACLHLYTKVDALEDRVSQLNEKISVLVSTELNKKS